MNKDFLNDVVFEKKIRLKKPKKRETREQLQKEKATQRKKRFNRKLVRLIYFILMVWFGLFATKFAIESVFSISSGRDVKFEEIWGGFWDGFNEEYKE